MQHSLSYKSLRRYSYSLWPVRPWLNRYALSGHHKSSFGIVHLLRWLWSDIFDLQKIGERLIELWSAYTSIPLIGEKFTEGRTLNCFPCNWTRAVHRKEVLILINHLNDLVILVSIIPQPVGGSDGQCVNYHSISHADFKNNTNQHSNLHINCQYHDLVRSSTSASLQTSL